MNQDPGPNTEIKDIEGLTTEWTEMKEQDLITPKTHAKVRIILTIPIEQIQGEMRETTVPLEEWKEAGKINPITPGTQEEVPIDLRTIETLKQVPTIVAVTDTTGGMIDTNKAMTARTEAEEHQVGTEMKHIDGEIITIIETQGSLRNTKWIMTERTHTKQDQHIEVET